jgi:hypothetical protein
MRVKSKDCDRQFGRAPFDHCLAQEFLMAQVDPVEVANTHYRGAPVRREFLYTLKNLHEPNILHKVF